MLKPLVTLRFVLTILPLLILPKALADQVEAVNATRPATSRPEPILSGCEYDYPPFCVTRPGKQPDGFSVQLLRAALEAMDRQVTFKVAPWAEIKQDLTDGRLQALPLVARSPEREAVFDFTFPYLTMHGTIVVRDDNTRIHGPDDLEGMRVAVLQEDIAHEYLRRSNLGAIIVPLPSYATAMQELSAGKHDAVVIQKLLAFQLMKDASLTNLRTVGPPLTGYSQTLCFAVRKGDDELLSLLNEGLSIIMANGTFRRLHAEWFSSLEAVGRTKSRIVVGGDSNYAPYEFLDGNGQPAGYNVDLTRAIARQMGLAVDIRLNPWSKVRSGLDRGEIDIVHGMFYSAERDRDFDFSPAHSHVQHVVVVREGSPTPAGMPALAGKSILVMAGDIMHDLAIKHGYEKQLLAVETLEEALRLLARGGADCALVARVPALYCIEKNGWRNLRVCDRAIISPEYCYAALHDKAALLADFSEGLAAIKETGEFRAIQNRWLSPYESDRVGFWTILKYGSFGALPLGALLMGSLLWSRSLKAQVSRRTDELRREMEHSRKTAEALRESEQRFRIMGEMIPYGVWWCNQNGGAEYVSQSFLDLLELTMDQAREFGWTRRLPPDEVEPMIERWMHCLDTGEDWDDEHHVLGPDGKYHYVLTRGKPVRDEDGNTIGWVGINLDIDQRKATQNALAENEHRLRLALAASRMGSYEWEPETGEINWSDATYSIWGYEPGEVEPCYDSYRSRIHPDDLRMVEQMLQESLAQRTEYSCQHRVVWADGSVHWVEARGRYISDSGKTRLCGVIYDATDRKRGEEERMAMLEAERAARSEAEKMVRLKDEFVSTCSHELRSPLSAIIGWGRLLEQGKAQPEKAAGIIVRSASALTQLVEDLLDMSRIMSGKIRLRQESASLMELVANAIEVVRFSAEAKSIHLDVSVLPDVVMLRCDPVRVQQIVLNLLTNAIKFTDEGGWVNIALSQTPKHVIISVQDNGKGISSEFLPYIWDRFRQEDGSIARRHGGLGLGLSIVKHLVELHGGTVSANSEGEGKGAKFTVSLPRVHQDAEYRSLPCEPVRSACPAPD